VKNGENDRAWMDFPRLLGQTSGVGVRSRPDVECDNFAALERFLPSSCEQQAASKAYLAASL